MITDKEREIIRKVAVAERRNLVEKYCTYDLYGRCIEASDDIVRELKKYGMKATSHQGYCLFEYYENCTDQPYADHVYTLYRKDGQTIYIDVTLDQFQSQFEKEIPPVVLLDYIPNFILKHKPGYYSLASKMCGWKDYYDGKDYYNNFDYWGKGRLQP